MAHDHDILHARRTLPAALLLLGLLLLLAILRSAPPAPASTVDPDQFSAARARALLTTLLGDGAPHPMGSAANARVRARIVARLRGLGLQPDIQRAFICDTQGVCGTVENVVARLPGTEPGAAVLVVAHYDSVDASAGVSDNGTGVSITLEIARLLAAGTRPRNTVLFLFDDGEEAGLLGAKAFAEGHPAMAEVRAVVNLEARGTSGKSMLFETSGNTCWLTRLYGRSASCPATSSLFSTVYSYLPNDTNLTVFKQRNLNGVNFAFIGDAARYHTPLDDVTHLDMGSLQHHGDSALAMVRALAEAPLDERRDSASECVFFDLFGLWMVQWSLAWSWALLALSVLLVAAVWLRQARQGCMSLRSFFRALAGFPTTLLFATALAALLHILLTASGDITGQWHASPGWEIAAYWAAGLLATCTAGMLVARRGAFWARWAALWGWWALLSVVTTLLAPGVSYLFLVPTLTAGLTAAAVPRVIASPAAQEALVVLIPTAAGACLWLPIDWLLYSALGPLSLPMMTVLIALLSTTLAPLLPSSGVRARWLLPAAMGMVTIAATITIVVVPSYSAQTPQPVNLVLLVDGDTGRASWLVSPEAGDTPAAMEAMVASPALAQPLPWQPWLRAATAPGPSPSLPAPKFDVIGDRVEGGKRRVRARIHSSRGAPRLRLAIPPAAQLLAVTMDGHPVPPIETTIVAWTGGWSVYDYAPLAPKGIEVELVFGGMGAVELAVQDESPALPAAGSTLRDARPATAVPFGPGDITTVVKRYSLPPHPATAGP